MSSYIQEFLIDCISEPDEFAEILNDALCGEYILLGRKQVHLTDEDDDNEPMIGHEYCMASNVSGHYFSFVLNEVDSCLTVNGPIKDDYVYDYENVYSFDDVMIRQAVDTLIQSYSHYNKEESCAAAIAHIASHELESVRHSESL